jgi:hypothetical protein
MLPSRPFPFSAIAAADGCLAKCLMRENSNLAKQQPVLQPERVMAQDTFRHGRDHNGGSLGFTSVS